MNADAFRHLYAYHFDENHKLWEHGVLALSEEQFTQPIAYSVGSVRDQIVHLIQVDEAWFSDLQGIAGADTPDLNDRPALQAYRDATEQMMGTYLAALTDDMLFSQPLSGEDSELYVWQVLMQVVNHGTDHRAQLLRALNDLGVSTWPQDYVFYAYGHPLAQR